MVTTATATTVGSIVNPMIDSIQGQLVEYIVGAAATAFFAVATWVGRKIGIKVTEHFNREAIELAANRYANSVIDLLQRELDAKGTVDMIDLLPAGIEYIKKGNPDAVKESGIDDTHLKRIVKGAIGDKVIDLVAKLR